MREERFCIDALRTEGFKCDQPQPVVKDVEHHDAPDLVGFRKVATDILQVPPLGLVRDSVPGGGLGSGLRVFADHLIEARFTDHIHQLYISKFRI